MIIISYKKKLFYYASQFTFFTLAIASQFTVFTDAYTSQLIVFIAVAGNASKYHPLPAVAVA